MIGLFGWPINRAAFYNELESSLPSGAALPSLHSLIRNRNYRKWLGVAIQERGQTRPSDLRATAYAEQRERVRPHGQTQIRMHWHRRTKNEDGRREGETATLQRRWMMIEGSWSAMEQPCAEWEWKERDARGGMDWCCWMQWVVAFGMSEMFEVWLKRRGGAWNRREKRRLLELYLEMVNTIAQKRIILLPKNGSSYCPKTVILLPKRKLFPYYKMKTIAYILIKTQWNVKN